MKLRRLLLPVAALAAGSIALSACNANLGDVAAEVGGVSISSSELHQTLAAATSDAGFRCVISEGGTEKTSGAGDSYSAAFAAQMLTTLVEQQALDARLRAEHIVTTKFAKTAASAELAEAFAPGGQNDQSCTLQGAIVLAQLPASVRQRLIDLQAGEDVLASRAEGVPFTAAGIAKWAAANPAQATLSCVELAAFTSPTSAASFEKAVKAGGDFATSATAAGTQPDSGCVQATTLPSAIASAVAALSPSGLTAPIAYQGEYLVLQLTSRRVATGAEAAQLLLNTASAKISAIVHSTLAAAKVTVDPAYGTWAKVQTTYEVVPPHGPPASALFNPSAVEPSSLTG